MLNKVSLFYIDNEDAKEYVEIDLLSTDYMGMDVIYLVIFFFIYSIMLFVVEMFSSKWAIGKYQQNSPDLTLIRDEEVKREIMKSNNHNVKDEELRQQEYSIRVKNVEKTYNSGCCNCSNQVKAVKNLSFCLEYGDCFAMLGVNGAGKSTMFKCLTYEEFPEKGDIFINGQSIGSSFEECRNLIGYCPQIDAIFEDMTVKENLEFYASIKGIPDDIKESIINSIIKEMNLGEFIYKLSGKLSGGNKRKLSVSIAMIGNPPIILLDEPSAGMDPEARRFMWAVIHKITKVKKRSSVILTTHSMEEAETLCQKMAIMVRGQFKCFGSASLIKQTYGTDFEIFLTINYLSSNEVQSTCNQLGIKEDDFVVSNQIPELLKGLKSRLNPDIIKKNDLGCELFDDLAQFGFVPVKQIIQWNNSASYIYKIIEHLMNTFPEVEISEYWGNTYQLKIPKNETVTIGYLFGLFDEIQLDCRISEYSISQTSMEQIFNNFANQDDFNNQTKGESLTQNVNHKPVLKVNSEVLRRNLSRI